ncbi:MAG: hypothetical protein KKE20_07330, partial [Nanoarchaeota archaeon]|nr:hypothetical protein [Nanoarchaeota archaeon]
MGDLENITMQDSSRELITKSHSTGFFRTAGKVLLTGAAVIAAYLGMTGTAKAEQGCSDGAHYLQPADSNYSLDCHAMGIMVYPGEKPIDALRSFQHTKKQEWLPLAIKYANQVYGETAMNTPATEQEVMRICVDLPSTAVVECTPNSQYTPPAPPIDKDDSKRGTPPTDTTTPGNPKEECVGSQYRGSTEYNALETDLMAYIPRLQAQIQETRPTNYQDIVN